MDLKCPLTDPDCQAINAILSRAAARGEYLAKLDKLGLDVSGLIEENNAQEKFCRDCKAEFFPREK